MEKNDFERFKSSSGKKRNDFVANPILRINNLNNVLPKQKNNGNFYLCTVFGFSIFIFKNKVKGVIAKIKSFENLIRICTK